MVRLGGEKGWACLGGKALGEKGGGGLGGSVSWSRFKEFIAE